MYETTANAKTALYRVWAEDGTLLYIGATYNPFNRLQQHKQKSMWHSLACRIEWTWHDDRLAALIAEEKAIRDEQPVYNIIHRNRMFGVDVDAEIKRRAEQE